MINFESPIKDRHLTSKKTPEKSYKFQKIAVTSMSFASSPELLNRLQELSNSPLTIETKQKWSEEEFASWLAKTSPDALVLGTEPLSSQAINGCKSLKAVGKYGVGFDNVDLVSLKANGVHWGYYPGVNKRSVSELVLGFMLGHFRNIFRSSSQMQAGIWKKDGGRQLSNAQVGIIGLGNIGQDLSHLLGGFGCNVSYFDIDETVKPHLLTSKKLPLEQLIQSSDVVTLHIPGSSQNKNFFDKEKIRLMKPGSLLVNTSRGDILDFEAASSAVSKGAIAGFASDVFPTEPFDSSKLLVESGFYFTPHIGGNSKEAVLAMGNAAIHGLCTYMNSVEG